VQELLFSLATQHGLAVEPGSYIKTLIFIAKPPIVDSILISLWRFQETALNLLESKRTMMAPT